ncbi:MAG: type VI secretion system contractile sheath large subunit [Gemmatimonadaceae bacterium]|jgi:type VI secretion system protein ImpC|nr:type VI secretion system contractile sheath large subunit [Gemmatimonadaceae bacterium]
MPKVKAAEGGVAVEESSLLDDIVTQGRLARDDSSKARGRDLIKRFVEEVLEGTVATSRDTETMINERIAQLDALISSQVDRIMHDDELQRLEASWRGLHYLLSRTEMGPLMKVRVLSTTKKELLKDFEKAPAFDRSALFLKVYEEEYGTFGGAPMGALLTDFQFGPSNEDVELLTHLSQVAAAAHAPMITGTSPEMLNLEDFTQLDAPTDIAKIFEPAAYARWKGFRQSEDSRYVSLTLPRMLLRRPYGTASTAIEGFRYEEESTDHHDYLWGNAAWALGAQITQAFNQYGWCACIRGVESGGLVTDLPVHSFRTESGEIAMKPPTETPITERRERELAEQGFTTLVHRKDSAEACFFAVPSAQKAKTYQSDAANANARLSAQIPYIFAVSRFAHYLKVMMRDKIGTYMSRDQAQSFLNNWIQSYVVSNDDASQEVKAKRPLKEARVDVEEIPGRPGALRAVAFLRPHFQLDELTVALRLVAELPKPAAR